MLLKCVKMSDGSHGFQIQNPHFPIKQAIKCAANTCGLKEKIIAGCEQCCPVASTRSTLKHFTKVSMQETSKCLNEESNWKNIVIIAFGIIILLLLIERFRKVLTKHGKNLLEKLRGSSNPSSSSNSTIQHQEGIRLRFPEGDWDHVDEDGDALSTASNRIVPVIQQPQASQGQSYEEKPLNYAVAPTIAPSWEP